MNGPLLLRLGIAGFMIGAVVIGVVLAQGRGKSGYGGDPVIELQGVVTEAGTGEPIEGAYVVFDAYSYKGVAIGHGTGGCAGLTAVRTDAEGVYRIRWDWKAQGMEVPDDLSVQLKVFKPGLTYDPPTFYPGYSPKERTDFELSRDTRPTDTRLSWLSRMLHHGCSFRSSVRDSAELSRAIYRDAWELVCLRESAPTEQQFFGAILVMKASQGALRSEGDTVADDVARRRKKAIRDHLPRIDRWGSWTAPRTDMNFDLPVAPETREALCQLLAQPVESIR